jgi:hypothetical protein
LEVSRLLPSIALRVHDRYNVKGDSCMREGSTAGAAFVCAPNSQKVLVLDEVRVSSRLDILSHIVVLLTVSFHDTLLLSLLRHFISNLS